MSRVNVGFWLYRTKRRDGTYHPRWRIRYHGPNGGLITATGFTDKGETRRLAQQLASEADEIRRGIRKPPQPADTESLKPIGERIDAYISWGRTQGGRGGRPWAMKYATNQGVNLEWWKQSLNLANLRDITLPAVESALQEKAKAGVTGKTLSNISGTLRAFVQWSLERQYLEASPLKGLRQFDTSVSHQNFRRSFTLEEVGKLLAGTPEPRNSIYRLALVSGFRAGEIKSLRVGDFDAKRRTIRLRAEYAKDRCEAVSSLPNDLTDNLTRLISGRPLEGQLFADWEHNHASDQISADMKRVGIEKRTFGGKADFHSLRTTHVNLGVHLGFDVKTAQTLARHKDPNLTMNVYGRADSERLKAAVEKMGEAIRGEESKQIRQTGVKQAAFAMAAGAEHVAYPHGPHGDDSNIELVGATGIEPARG